MRWRWNGAMVRPPHQDQLHKGRLQRRTMYLFILSLSNNNNIVHNFLSLTTYASYTLQKDFYYVVWMILFVVWMSHKQMKQIGNKPRLMANLNLHPATHFQSSVVLEARPFLYFPYYTEITVSSKCLPCYHQAVYDFFFLLFPGHPDKLSKGGHFHLHLPSGAILPGCWLLGQLGANLRQTHAGN